MITVKPGATFSMALVLRVVRDGAEVADLTGWAGECDLRFDNGAIRGLAFAWIDAAARSARVSFAGSTGDWPLGGARLDVQLTAPGGAPVVISDTVMLRIGDTITRRVVAP